MSSALKSAVNPESTSYFELTIPSFMLVKSSSEADWQVLIGALPDSSLEELKQADIANRITKAVGAIRSFLNILSMYPL
jgi:hypothetical protein